MTAHEVRTWRDVQDLLEGRPRGAVLRVPKGVLPHPRTHGMRPTVSVPAGQRGEWFRPYEGGGGLHVLDHGAHYHCEIVVPAAPGAFDPSASAVVVGGCAAAGAAIGAATGRTNGAVLAGALLGALLGAAVLAAAEKEA